MKGYPLARKLVHSTFLLLLVFQLFSCQEVIDSPVPDISWQLFDAPSAHPISRAEGEGLEGVYKISGADYAFGDTAALHQSYTVNGKDTVYHLSIFCEEEAAYFICTGKRNDSALMLNGYWRKMVNTQTGRIRLTVEKPRDGSQGLVFYGVYGDGEEDPDKNIEFRFVRPLNIKPAVTIVAHRGGGRNNDLLPASENSVEMIKLAARMGANGIEIDVKLTSDGVPVLYHDERIDDRLTEKAGLKGAIDEYSLAALSKIKLKRGGSIPTLEQALDTVLYKTPLEFVWLDCKYKGSMQRVLGLQQDYTKKAAAIGRKLRIIIGIPDETVMEQFTMLPNYQEIPALTELDTSFAQKLHVDIWGPSWTKGLQNEEVGAMHAKGIESFVWTLDAHKKIKEYLRDGHFDGVVTNRPSMAAFYHYTAKP